ncbi:hypothetical protein KIPB_012107, partial [Kipferlia bialata]
EVVVLSVNSEGSEWHTHVFSLATLEWRECEVTYTNPRPHVMRAPLQHFTVDGQWWVSGVYRGLMEVWVYTHETGVWRREKDKLLPEDGYNARKAGVVQDTVYMLTNEAMWVRSLGAWEMQDSSPSTPLPDLPAQWLLPDETCTRPPRRQRKLGPPSLEHLWEFRGAPHVVSLGRHLVTITKENGALWC